MSAKSLPLAALLAITTLGAGCGGGAFSAASATPDSGGVDSGGPDSGEQDSGSRDAAVLDAPPDDGGSADGSGGLDVAVSDAPGDASSWSPDCPVDAPTAGESCSQAGLQCEYGDAWWSISCDVVMECQGGQWAKSMPSFGPCAPQPGPNSSACPKTFTDVPKGSCSPSGLTCEYAQGQCSCAMSLVGPVLIDGGTAFWSCLPGMGCPFPRPRVGVACSSEGLSCSYEACSYDETCQSGVWQAQGVACGATAAP